MTRNDFITGAESLKPISAEALAEYEKKSDILIVLINNHMQSRPDLYTLIGKDNLQMMFSNHTNHVRFMTAIMKNFNPRILVETILWVLRTYKSHGFSISYWPAQISSWITILQAELSSNAVKEILPFYQWIEARLAQMDAYVTEYPEEE
ncbi:MAG: hypothetical protein HRU80_09445 [Ignavibacteriales bacterium]|nr:hypothetical protein [Ignavibacteriaceae bacterium]QOJ29095.1 MAG: hypothetical protein HRU80_09445 [Ignavibacteriales bacterium]